MSFALRTLPLVAAALTMMTLAPMPAFAVVYAQPDSVTFTSHGQRVAIKVLNDGVPVPASRISSVRLLVEPHDYDHMVKVTTGDGVVNLEAAEALEVGSYTLAITTADGQAKVSVYAPLSELPNTLENRARLLGISDDEMRQRLGLTSETGREAITIQLPPVYYVGQTLTLPMDTRPDRHCTWMINNKVVLEGLGKSTLVHTFTETRDCVLTYIERQGNAIVASATAYTKVVDLPAMRIEAARGEMIALNGPAGFSRYSWTVEDSVQGKERAFTHSFKDSGVYKVVVSAEGPLPGWPEGWQRFTYVIHVR